MPTKHCNRYCFVLFSFYLRFCPGVTCDISGMACWKNLWHQILAALYLTPPPPPRCPNPGEPSVGAEVKPISPVSQNVFVGSWPPFDTSKNHELKEVFRLFGEDIIISIVTRKREPHDPPLVESFSCLIENYSGFSPWPIEKKSPFICMSAEFGRSKHYVPTRLADFFNIRKHSVNTFTKLSSNHLRSKRNYSYVHTWFTNGLLTRPTFANKPRK